VHLKWTRPAIGDLKEAGDFIASDNPSAAQRMAERVQEAVEYLLDHPDMGRPGRVSGTRELVV
jgi:plasmid stabilization system protein ParE